MWSTFCCREGNKPQGSVTKPLQWFRRMKTRNGLCACIWESKHRHIKWLCSIYVTESKWIQGGKRQSHQVWKNTTRRAWEVGEEKEGGFIYSVIVSMSEGVINYILDILLVSITNYQSWWLKTMQAYTFSALVVRMSYVDLSVPKPKCCQSYDLLGLLGRESIPLLFPVCRFYLCSLSHDPFHIQIWDFSCSISGTVAVLSPSFPYKSLRDYIGPSWIIND